MSIPPAVILGTAGGFAFTPRLANILSMTIATQMIVLAEVTAAAIAAIWVIYFFGDYE